MPQTYDIVIIGGGIIGMATAWQLRRRSAARILVLEKGKGPAEGSTGASSAVCRFRYTHPETIRLAVDGISAYRDWEAFTGLETPRARFQNDGALWLADPRPGWAAGEVARLSQYGVRASALDDDALGKLFPSLNTCTLAPDLTTGDGHACRGGAVHLLELDAGYVDPVDALQDLIDCSRRAGVEVRFGAQITDLVHEGGRVAGVVVGTGETIHCGMVVCAAGPWCREIYALAGLNSPWPLEPTRIQVAHITRPAELQGPIPVTVDLPGGIYFRLQNRGQQIIVGSVLEDDEREAVSDPDDFARYADDAFVREKLHILAHRLPGLGDPAQVRGYSGLYTMNRADMHPVVGVTPIDGLLVANGFSGHGFKLAPAIGSLLARTIAGDRLAFDTDVDPAFLAFDRKPIALTSMSVLA